MNFINQEDLENFMNKFPEEGDEQPQEYCNSAMEMVRDYLGYDPEEQEYTSIVKGDNGYLIQLAAFPITEISDFKINGESHDIDEICIVKENYIELDDGSPFIKGNKYTFIYTAGFEEVPALIKLTALQIASLFWESAGGNLAVSSTSFADTGSRVFNNFTADRFLKQIEKYKKVI